MISNFRFKALSIVIIFTTLFIFYNHNNSSEPPSETTQNQFQNTDKELLKAINLLNKEVFSLKEEIKDIKEDLAFNPQINEAIISRLGDVNVVTELPIVSEDYRI